MKINIISVMATAALLTACDGDKYDLESIVPDQYHKILYINNSGTQNLTLYNTGEANIFTLSIYKGGSAPSQPATATLGVLSQETVYEEYSAPEGAHYKVVGEDCYSFDTPQLSFGANDRYKTVTVSLDIPSIQKVMDANPDSTCVLPLCLYSESDSINKDKGEVFLKLMEILMPAVGFTTTDITYVPFTYGFATETTDIEFGLDTENKWDIDCTFEVDPDYLAAYNEKNGTTFAALPEGSYSFEKTTTLPSGTTTGKLAVTLQGSNIQPGDYMLPVRLKDVSLFNVSTNAVYPLVLHILGTKLDRSGWSITANTEETSGEGVGNGIATCLLDGNLNSFWHSQWSGSSISLPHILTVDTKETVTFTQFGLMQRQHSSFRDVVAGNFYVSTDGSTWTKVRSFSMQRILEEQIFTIPPTKGRYFRIEITQSNRGINSSLAEAYAYGMK